jgi:Mce-associated membrane protein
MTDFTETESPVSTDTETAHDAQRTADEPLGAETDIDLARSDDTARTELRSASGVRRKRLLSYGVLLALTLAAVCGAVFMVWQDRTEQSASTATATAVSAATETTVAMLSYTPENAARDLPAKRRAD